jgi:hypothetical protein
LRHWAALLVCLRTSQMVPVLLSQSGSSAAGRHTATGWGPYRLDAPGDMYRAQPTHSNRTVGHKQQPIQTVKHGCWLAGATLVLLLGLAHFRAMPSAACGDGLSTTRLMHRMYQAGVAAEHMSCNIHINDTMYQGHEPLVHRPFCDMSLAWSRVDALLLR